MYITVHGLSKEVLVWNSNAGFLMHFNYFSLLILSNIVQDSRGDEVSECSASADWLIKL